MKRLLLLCAIVLSLGMAGTAVAAPFGIFDSSLDLKAQLQAAYAGGSFTGFDFFGILNQNLYANVIYASDAAQSAVAGFDDMAALWYGQVGGLAANAAGLQLTVNSQSYNILDLVSRIVLYQGTGLGYSPEAGLGNLLIEGGSIFVALSLPGSNGIDIVYAFSANGSSFKHAPAPAALLLFGTGFAGIIAARRRAKN